MDGDGIPLAFCINKGNTNEQVTLKPLEKKIISDFDLSKFIVSTDAGLASNSNRNFNDKDDIAFITTQSIKKLKKHLKEWALDISGWNLGNSDKTYSLDKLDEQIYDNKIFYKECWINEDGLGQKLVATFSLKYKKYQQTIRSHQVERLQKIIDSKSAKEKKCNANDYKRFIAKDHCTVDG